MAGRETWKNNNSSLASLDGLDPDTKTSTNVILSMNRKEVKVAPAGYTEETADKFAELIGNYRFASNVKFYKATVTITVDSEGKRKRNIWYEKDSYSAVRQRIGQGLTAHLWLNDAGEVYAVLVDEEKVVLE